MNANPFAFSLVHLHFGIISLEGKKNNTQTIQKRNNQAINANHGYLSPRTQ